MELGEKIRKYRTEAGLTQTKLGEMIEVAPRTISKWESGVEEPTLTEIRKVCKALGIQKTDLVEEEPVKLKKEVKKPEKLKSKLDLTKQKYLRGLSGAITIVAKVLRVLLYIAIGAICFCIVCVPFIFNSFEVNDHIITVKGYDEKLELVNEDNMYKIKVGDKEDLIDLDIETKYVDQIFDNYSKTKVVCLLEITFIIAASSMLIVTFILKGAEELFRNIEKGEAFTMENALLLKNIGYLMIASIVIPVLAGIVPDAVLGTDFSDSFTLVDIVEVLFVFAISFLFEYGAGLQEESKLPLYDED